MPVARTLTVALCLAAVLAAASARAGTRACGPGSFRVAFLDALGEARTGGLPLPEAEGTP